MKVLVGTIFLTCVVFHNYIQLSAQMRNSNEGNNIVRPPAPPASRPPAPAQGRGSAPPAQISGSEAQRNLISLPIPMPNQRRVNIDSGIDIGLGDFVPVNFDSRVYGYTSYNVIRRELNRDHSPPRSPEPSPPRSPQVSPPRSPQVSPPRSPQVPPQGSASQQNH